MSKKTTESIRLKLPALNEQRGTYFFQLFVTGSLPNSVRAIKNINAICEEHLKGCYKLEVIDIHEQPSIALKEEIIAVPFLVKKFPLPELRMIGDLSNIEMVLKTLDLV